MYTNGHPHMAEQKQDDQLCHYATATFLLMVYLIQKFDSSVEIWLWSKYFYVELHLLKMALCLLFLQTVLWYQVFLSNVSYVYKGTELLRSIRTSWNFARNIKILTLFKKKWREKDMTTNWNYEIEKVRRVITWKTHSLYYCCLKFPLDQSLKTGKCELVFSTRWMKDLLKANSKPTLNGKRGGFACPKIWSLLVFWPVTN